jgi:hypothetical protein
MGKQKRKRYILDDKLVEKSRDRTMALGKFL